MSNNIEYVEPTKESAEFQRFRDELVRMITEGFLLPYEIAPTPTICTERQKIGRGTRPVKLIDHDDSKHVQIMGRATRVKHHRAELVEQTIEPVTNYTKLDPWHTGGSYKPDMVGIVNGNTVVADFKLSGRAADIFIVDEAHEVKK